MLVKEDMRKIKRAVGVRAGRPSPGRVREHGPLLCHRPGGPGPTEPGGSAQPGLHSGRLLGLLARLDDPARLGRREVGVGRGPAAGRPLYRPANRLASAVPEGLSRALGNFFGRSRGCKEPISTRCAQGQDIKPFSIVRDS